MNPNERIWSVVSKIAEYKEGDLFYNSNGVDNHYNHPYIEKLKLVLIRNNTTYGINNYIVVSLTNIDGVYYINRLYSINEAIRILKLDKL